MERHCCDVREPEKEQKEESKRAENNPTEQASVRLVEMSTPVWIQNRRKEEKKKIKRKPKILVKITECEYMSNDKQKEA